jgi:hypothetical protein
MKRRSIVAAVALMVMYGEATLACPSCYGSADGPMIQGMNMAILTMLGITGFVLAGISSFFLMMRHRIKRLRSGQLNRPHVNEQGILQYF